MAQPDKQGLRPLEGKWWRSLTVRITLLATAATAVVLIVVLAGVVALFTHQLAASSDDGLRARLGYLRGALSEGGPVAVTTDVLAELSDHGRLVLSSAPAAGSEFRLLSPDRVGCAGLPAFFLREHAVPGQAETVRLRVLAACLPDGQILAVGVALRPQEEAREHLLLLLALASPILLSVVSLTVGRAVHLALRRVDVLTRQAAQITEGRHTGATWQPIPGNDETYTSAGYRTSLQSALDTAHLH